MVALNILIKLLYFIETMDDSPPYGSLATRLAALQQKMCAGTSSLLLSASRADEGPLPSSSRRAAGLRGSALGLPRKTSFY